MLPLIAVLLLSFVASQSYCSSDSTSFCIFGNANSTHITYTIYSSFTGYVAMGISSTAMSNADIYVMWKNTAGTVMLSKRHATSNSSPDLDGVDQDAAVLPAIDKSVKIPSSAKIAISFIRPLASANAKSIPATTAIGYIWAGSNSLPSSPDSPRASISKHSATGKFTCDLTSTSASGSPIIDSGEDQPLLQNLDRDIVLFIHGTIMFIAWGIAPFIGIFVARYLKDILGAWWFRIHMFMMIGLTGCGSLAAFILIFLYESRPHFIGDEYNHRIMGLVVTVILLIQLALGFVSNYMFEVDRKSIPWYDRAHWYLGRISFTMALVTCFLGLQAFGASLLWKIMLIVWIVICALCFAGGEWMIGQVNHMSKLHASSVKGDVAVMTANFPVIGKRYESLRRMGRGRNSRNPEVGRYVVLQDELNNYPIPQPALKRRSSAGSKVHGDDFWNDSSSSIDGPVIPRRTHTASDLELAHIAD